MADEAMDGRGLSRRALFGAAGAAAGAAVLAGGTIGGYQAGRAAGDQPDQSRYDFRGIHQSGIVTPQQDRLHFASFDVTTESRDRLIGLLRRWSAAAAVLMAGAPIGSGAAGNHPSAPPDDSGEALDLPAAGLTITIGFGRSLFVHDGVERFGIGAALPEALIDLPAFAGDQLEPALVGGDLCVQACANDPQVAVHAIRTLTRLASGDAAVSWAQLGFGRTSSTSRAQLTPRNLMGFKDGTHNLVLEDDGRIRQWLWARGEDGQAWMDGGSYLVARKMRIFLENWDRTSLTDQEAAVGRSKVSGAPLSGGQEFTAPDFQARGAAGQLLIPQDAHVTIAHPNRWSGAMMMRRGYNYTDGADALGNLDAGLFFMAFMRDPRVQFVPILEEMARADRMITEYTRTIGSATFAIPPGVPADAPADAFVGEGLFA